MKGSYCCSWQGVTKAPRYIRPKTSVLQLTIPESSLNTKAQVDYAPS